MSKWIKIFKSGTYPQGTVGVSQLDTIAKNFESNTAGVPLTIDHIKNGPSFGWVDKLKREGEYLLATFKDVHAQMKEWVKNKQYLNRSVELSYNESTKDFNNLRAVTMLGAATPQIPLGSISEFKEGNDRIICFVSDEHNDSLMFEDETTSKEDKGNISLFEKTYTDKATGLPIETDWQVKYQNYKANDEKEDMILKLKEENRLLKEKSEDYSIKVTKNDCANFITTMVKDFKLTPNETNNRKIMDFMLTLDNKQNAKFQEIVMGLPKHRFSDFEESKDRYLNYSTNFGAPSNEDLHQRVLQFMKKNEIKDYNVALPKVLELQVKEAGGR